MIAVIAVIAMIAVIIALIAPFARVPFSGIGYFVIVDRCKVCHPFPMAMLRRVSLVH